MHKTTRRLAGLTLLACLLQAHCAAPRLFWPQKDIRPATVELPAARARVLVASRSSLFKDALVERLKATFEERAVAARFVGLDLLAQERPSDYQAVVLINTCIAGGLDRQVQAFLDQHPDQQRTVVLTTSGDGGWLPDTKGRTFDALCTASKPVRLDSVAAQVVERVDRLLQR